MWFKGHNTLVAGMYTMRLLDSNNSNNASSVGSIGTALQPSEERMDASSDSAVSSMGSERVPSLSDGEWMETGSDSGHTTGDHYAMDYHARYELGQIYNRMGY
jgi:nuclear factor erythroid 2